MAKKIRVKKKVRRAARSISKARQQRRALFAQQPVQARMIAASLLPQSRRQAGKKVGHHRREVLRLRAAVTTAPDAASRAHLAAQLSAEIKQLAAAVHVANKKRDRARRGGMTGVEKVTAAQAKSRFSGTKLELAKTDKLLKALTSKKALKRGGPAVQQRNKARVQLLIIKKLHLQRRHGLLKRGLDFERPVRLHPSRVPIQRVKLTLPAAWSVPSHADITVLIRLLGSQVKRLPHESDRRFVQRLRAYSQRALIRFVNLRATHITGPTAIRQAAEATIAEDGPALNAESEAGGVVADPTAEAVDNLIQPVSDQLDAAAEDMQSEIPAGEPTHEELEKILGAASEAEADAAGAPIEPADEMEEDLIAADEPFAPDIFELDEEFVEEETPEEGVNPMLVMGVIGGLGLLWFLSGR
jgi:hypothetical protein